MLETHETKFRIFAQFLLGNFVHFFARQVGKPFAGLLSVGLRQGGPHVHMLETDGTKFRIFAQLLLANCFEFFAQQVGMLFAGLLSVIWE